MARYEASKGSNHQCCNEARVVDNEQLAPWGEPMQVCECSDLATAEEIALALNRSAMT